MLKASLIVGASCLLLFSSLKVSAQNDPSMPVAAPIHSESAGLTGNVANQSVVRVACPEQNSIGSGFLHRSGHILTAEHVVHGCKEAILFTSSGAQLKATVKAVDVDSDIALLWPVMPMLKPSLPLSSMENIAIGAQVVTWGFPIGYLGLRPLLGVGYLAGDQMVQTPSGKFSGRFVVNAAFNSGNSGGPLIHIETGTVIGIVSSKLAPMSGDALSALEALQKQKSGFTYEATRPDGTKSVYSEGQIVGMVLLDLRKQVQLVIGMATPVAAIREFFSANAISP